MFIKRLFRREPLTSTVVTAGSVNILLGMMEGQALLAFIGVLVVSGTLANRGWQKYRRIEFPETSVRYLPEQTSQSPMPIISSSSQRHPDSE
ncbi:MAG: hypothetical protein AAF722_10970 [Cyanobacteria bacterium P01_C01_bin.70]